MNKFLKSLGQSAQSFLRDEEGAQIIEYALIIAVVSLALIALMSTNSLGMDAWITKVNCYLTTGAACA